MLDNPLKVAYFTSVFFAFNVVTALAGGGGLYIHRPAWIVLDYLFPGLIFMMSVEKKRRREMPASEYRITVRSFFRLLAEWASWLFWALRLIQHSRKP